MYPTITDFLKDVFGFDLPLPIQTFGFFMAMGFLAAFFYLRFAMKEKTKQGIFKEAKVLEIIGLPASISEILSNAIFGLVVGWKIFPAITNYMDLVNNPQGFILSMKGNIPAGIICAVLFGFLTYYLKQRKVLAEPKQQSTYLTPQELVGDILGVAAISGVLGAKLLSVFEDWSSFIANPIAALFSFSGLTWYGGLIGGAAAVSWYVLKRKNMIHYKHMLDAAAPAIIIGYGVGRLGCHFAGDGDWGVVNALKKPFEFLPDWLWAYNYPGNVIQSCHSYLKDGTIVNGDCIWSKTPYIIDAVWPTPVYEFIIGTIIFLILVSIRNKFKAPGVLFGIYLIFNGLERFFIEVWRINNRYAYNLSLSQFIAIGLVILGIIAWIFFAKTHKPTNENLENSFN